MDKNPFIIAAVVGQELMTAGHTQASMKVLEAARGIGTDSLKLEAALLQALGRVHWALNNTDKALAYMEEDLKINESLGEHYGSVRAHDNLGIAYSSVGRHEDAINHHYLQLQLADSHSDYKEMVNSYNRLGAAFCKLGMYPHALKAYKDAYRLAKELPDQSIVLKGLVNLAETHMEAGDLEKSLQWFHQELQQAKDARSKADAYSHLGHVCHLKGNYDQSMMYYQQLLSLAVQMDNMALKAKAYGGMGQANRALGNLWPAQSCREQQLKLCQDTFDEDGQLVALIHLGHIQRAAGKLSQAIQYYNRALSMAQKLQDKAGEAKAYSSLGSCHTMLGNLREAINYYNQELVVVEKTEDKVSETLALGSLGMAELALESTDMAHQHLTKSLQLAEEIGDEHLLCLALSNLGSYMTVVKQFAEAPTHLTRALKLAQGLKNFTMESKVCHNLALCHEGLGNYQQAIQYFQHDFMVARETQDKERMTQACEKLVKANREIGDKEQAEVYQRQLMSIAEESQKASGKCSLWNQMAEEAVDNDEYDKAIECYENLLKEAKNQQHHSFEGVAFRGLGNSHMAIGNCEHALSYYQRDLAVRKAAGDLPGECDAYNNMGTAHNSLDQHGQALECFDQQLRLAQQLDNPLLIIKAYSCLGIVHRNIGNIKEALQYHQLQVNTAFHLKENVLEQASACANLGDTHESIGNYSDAVKMQEQHLQLAKKAKSSQFQMRALASLGRAQRGLGAIRKALQYFEQRLKLAKDLGDYYIEAECYADIGENQLLLRDYTHASEAFTKQLEISRQLQDSFSEALAASGLGEVQFRLGNYREAIEHHMYDYRLSTQNELLDGEVRALGNIAEVYELMKDYRNAIAYREKQISVADTIRDDRYIHTVAFTGLGKIYLRVGDFPQAVSLLKQALGMLCNPYRQDSLNQESDEEMEAKVRFYLGQAFYHNGQNDHALSCLQKSLPLFEHLREKLGMYDHATKQTLELLPILYQTLVCVLVRLNKVEDALEMAEREKNRMLVDALLERDVNKQTMRECGLMKPFAPQSSWIHEAINHLKCPVVYYSVALRHIFIWLLHPKTGIIQFQTVDMSDLGTNSMSDTASIFSENSSTYLQPLADSITTVRESLGVEPRRHSAKSMGSATSDESGEDTESVHSADQFLSPNRGSRSRNSKGLSVQVLHELYDLLIRPIESGFTPPPPGGPGHRGQVLIIPDKDLYLLPFPLLKAEGSSVYLFQQFHLHFSPSLQALIAEKNQTSSTNSSRKLSSPVTSQLPTPKKHLGHPKSPSLSSSELLPSHSLKSQSPINGVSGNHSSSPIHLVIGNPSIPISASQCNWQPMVGAEKEVKQVAEKLEVTPLLGPSASKDAILKQISEAESVFLSVNVSWSHSYFVLASTELSLGDLDQNDGRGNADGAATSTRRGVADGSAEGAMPEPSKYLLSLSDIMDAKLQAKLVVISGSHRSDSPHLSAGSLLCMADAILAGGAHAVLLPLWSTSHQGSRLMMNAFYSSLLYGSKTSRALSYAMQVCVCVCVCMGDCCTCGVLTLCGCVP